MFQYHVINKDCSFYQLIFPLIEYLDKLYWCIEVQCGLIDTSCWLLDDETEETYFSQKVEHELFTGWSTKTFKPGSLLLFGEHIRRDEHAVYFGFSCSEAIALDKIMRYIFKNDWPEDWFPLLDLPGSLIIYHRRYPRWEIYSKCNQYLQYFETLAEEMPSFIQASLKTARQSF